MGKIRLCVGEYAKIPYCFENLGIRVYSAEELCYVLKENAFLLDREIVNKKLVKWIEEILKLPELAAMLYPFLRQKTSVGAFAGVILRYIGFYEEEVICRTEELFHRGSNLNVYERLKSRVDYMVENGRYAPAIAEYNSLLHVLPSEEINLTAMIYHNKGVALCGLFLFEEAAAEFKKAYDIIPKEEILVEYLAAKRLSMEEGDYVSFAAGVPDYYEETLLLEKRVEELRSKWEETEVKNRLDTRLSLKEEGYMTKYYEETEEWLQEIKSRYRESAGSW